MTWANRITIARILLIPVFAGLLIYYEDSLHRGFPLNGLRLAAFSVFAVAAISDGIDGFLSRHFNQRSRLGAVLDPLADKLLLLVGLLLLCVLPWPGGPLLPLWFVILSVSRDMLVVLGCGVVYTFNRQIKIQPNWLGKTATFLQLIIIGVVLLQWPGVLMLCIASAAGTVLSALIYGKEMLRQLDHSGYGHAD